MITILNFYLQKKYGFYIYGLEHTPRPYESIFDHCFAFQLQELNSIADHVRSSPPRHRPHLLPHARARRSGVVDQGRNNLQACHSFASDCLKYHVVRFHSAKNLRQ